MLLDVILPCLPITDMVPLAAVPSTFSPPIRPFFRAVSFSSASSPPFSFLLLIYAHPIVDPAYLRGPVFDLYLISNATKASRSVSQTAPLSDIVTTEFVPGLSSVPLNASDDVWQEWVLANVQPVIHPIGTVAMLPRQMGGAVGSDLKLYGTSNVRVVGESASNLRDGRFVCM